MKEKTVCFTGYRPAKMPCKGDGAASETIQIKAILCRAIREVIEAGYTHFIIGMAQGWDVWAGEAVVEVRKEYEGITLEGAFPFRGHGERLRGNERERFIRLIGELDKITICNEAYSSRVYHVRNRYMVDNSSLIICYYDGQAGGTGYTVGYARERGLKIVNIAE